MPIYEYFCRQCGSRIEEFRPVRDRDVNFPTCCDKPMSLVISTTHFKFKGDFMDGKNIGKEIKAKNERLKKLYADSN